MSKITKEQQKQLTMDILAILPLSEIAIDFNYFRKGSGKKPFKWKYDTVIPYLIIETEILPQWLVLSFEDIEFERTDKYIIGLAKLAEDGEKEHIKNFEKAIYDVLISRSESQKQLRDKIKNAIQTGDFLPHTEIALYVLEQIKSLYNE